MRQEEPGRSEPIGPLDWLKRVPFQAAAASAGLGWVGLEARVVLEELSARLPSLRLVPGQTLRFQPNTTFRGPLSLLVEWDA